MHTILNTFITSLSLGLFCTGVNLYIDLHIGFEFLSIAVALEVASVLVAVAVSKNLDNLNVDVFSLAALGVLIVSAYSLFAINFVSAFSYFVALLCLVVPVVLIGIFLIIVGRDATIEHVKTIDAPVNNALIKNNPMKNLMISSAAGLFASVVIAHYIFDWEGVWGVFMLSSAAFTTAIILRASISNIIKVSALSLLIGAILYVNSNLGMQLASWSLSGKAVSKYSLNMLTDPEQHGWLVEKTVWKKGSRIDIVTTSRSRNEGSFWTIHDANILVPYVHKANASVKWWEKHYPLMILPFELKKPSKVLTIATVRGADADISQQLYGAETTSIYNNCLSLKGGIPCNSSALNVKLAAALGIEKRYDLVSLSNYNEILTPYTGATAQHEAIHTLDIFQKLYDSLNSGGLLAINARDQTMLRKSLGYVWRTLSTDDEDKVISYENNIRVLALNKYRLQNDAYNYLVLVSKDGFTSEQIQKIDSFVTTLPISKIMYGSGSNNVPDRLTVSSAILALSKLSSREFKEHINLEPSSIIKPDYFYLSKTLHPFFAVLSAIFLSLGIYGLVFAHGELRNLDAAVHQRAPGLSKLLFQALLCAAAFVFVLYSIAYFTSASLGYSSHYMSLLIITTLTAFAVPLVSKRTGWSVLRTLSGIWLYPAGLLLCVLILVVMNQDVLTLLSASMQAVIIILAVLLAFCSGLLYRQTAVFIEQFYPDVFFWFWCMTAVGTVLGVILAKYILIIYNLEIVVKTAISLFVVMGFIAWWSLAALQNESDDKDPELEVSG